MRLPQLCQKREDESDIVQHTLMDATRGLPEFRGETEAEFEAWMSRLLERNILQSVRRHTADKRDVRREVIDQESARFGHTRVAMRRRNNRRLAADLSRRSGVATGAGTGATARGSTDCRGAAVPGSTIA